jgi:type III pantothenate kinase
MSVSSLLAIDVGNTQTVLGLYQDDQLVHNWRLETKKERTADEWGIFLLDLFRVANIEPKVHGIIISNVVPPLRHALGRMSERYFDRTAVFVDHQTDCGLKIDIEQPEEVGADRLVNAVAARAHVDNAAVIVVDFGTATTFDAINADGVYLGGAISPGIIISNDALAHQASRLPRIDIQKPTKVVGTTTQQSMQAGIYYGYVGLVDGMVARMQEEMSDTAKVIATGGLAGLLSQETKAIDEVVPNLTLDGLLLIWKRQKK